MDATQDLTLAWSDRAECRTTGHLEVTVAARRHQPIGSDWLTSREAADLMSVDIATVRSLARNGTLRHRIVGSRGALRIDAASVAQFLRDHAPDMFFPRPKNAAEAARAKAICHRCPVLDECLQYALDERINDGIWGATTPEQRRLLRDRKPRGYASEILTEAEKARIRRQHTPGNAEQLAHEYGVSPRTIWRVVKTPSPQGHSA